MNDLYLELLRAHQTAATSNMNGSLMVAHTVFQASGSMTQALAAACLAQGGLHAPIEAARELLRCSLRDDGEFPSSAVEAQWLLEMGKRVPGFGNSFFKNGDPAFAGVERILREDHPELVEIVDSIRKGNPKLPPANAAMWTACCLEALKMPVGMGPAVFIAARVKEWALSIIGAELNEDTTASVDMNTA